MPLEISTAENIYPPIEDRDPMSDEEFFGIWDEENEEWTLEGKLNYAYSEELTSVGEYVKKGEYDNAKNILLSYFQKRDIPKPTMSAGRNSNQANFIAQDIIYSGSSPIGFFSIDNTPQWHKIDVPVNTDGFIIIAKDKSDTTAYFSSRESNQRPYLAVVQNGKTKVLYPQKDTYVRAGLFQYDNFGSEQQLLVRDGGLEENLPLNDNTMQTYLYFNLSVLDSSIPVTTAKLNLYGYSDSEVKNLVLLSSSSNSWSESTGTWNTIPATVASWNGLEGGYDWGTVEYELLHDQFGGSNGRLIPVRSVAAEYVYTEDEYYAYHALRQFLDFIGDNGGLAYKDTTPLNAGFRIQNSVEIFLWLLDSIYMTPDVLVSILKYMWHETDAVCLEENFEYDWLGRGSYNGTAFELDALFRTATYFPEFADRDAWMELSMERLLLVSDSLIRTDGGYKESVSGYPDRVMGTFLDFYEYAEIAGIDLPEHFDAKYRMFVKYMATIMRPDGQEPEWGDGGPQLGLRGRINTVNKTLDDPLLEWFATSGGSGEAPDYTSMYYPDAKIAALRSGWSSNNDIYSFVIGRVGENHSHPHALHMTAYAYGRNLLTDVGMSSYDQRDPHFAFQRNSTKSHNTIEINNKAQRKPSDASGYTWSDAELITNGMFDELNLWSDAYKGFRHNRRIMMLKDKKFWIVSDYVEAFNDDSNRYNLTWHTQADAKITLDEDTKILKTNYDNGPNLQILPLYADDITATLQEGPSVYEPNGKRKIADTEYVSYVKEQTGSPYFYTILYPSKEEDHTEVQAQEIPLDVDGDVAAAFKIELPFYDTNAYYYTSHELKPSKRRFADYETDAQSMYIEYDANNNIDNICAVEAESLTLLDGQVLFSAKEKTKNLSIKYGGSLLEIENEDISNSQTLQIFAPDIETVELNGEKVDFVKNGDYVYVGDTSEITPEPTAPPSAEPSRKPSSPSSGGGGGRPSIIDNNKPVVVPTPEPSQKPNDNDKNTDITFSDIEGHWAQKEIEALVDHGIVNGVSEEQFEPDRFVKRAEFISMVLKSFGIEETEYRGEFNDVTEDQWYANVIQAAYDKGIISGYEGMVYPEDNITRAEAAKIVVTALLGDAVVENGAGKQFLDYGTFPEWSKKYIDNAVSNGIMKGMDDGTLGAFDNLTRAQAAVMVYRIRFEKK